MNGIIIIANTVKFAVLIFVAETKNTKPLLYLSDGTGAVIG